MTACPARTALRRAVVAAPKARPEPNRGHALNDRYRRVSPVCARPREGLLSQPTAVARPRTRERVFVLRVFGRLPVSGVTRCSEAGVRKASGEETAGGVCAGSGVGL